MCVAFVRVCVCVSVSVCRNLNTWHSICGHRSKAGLPSLTIHQSRPRRIHHIIAITNQLHLVNRIGRRPFCGTACVCVFERRRILIMCNQIKMNHVMYPNAQCSTRTRSPANLFFAVTAQIARHQLSTFYFVSIYMLADWLAAAVFSSFCSFFIENGQLVTISCNGKFMNDH